ncbi:MAG: DUF1501 domain-containing protein [Saprospiraceae bacterium]|nr:DUF1501 domain-containing protein [Saprospiraceae bacterium]
MKRRDFLRSGSVLSLPIALGGSNVGVLAQTQLGQLMPENSDRIFVLIQQNGGNDGLNTIIPIDQYGTLTSLRSDILVPENQILTLTEETGMHPAMPGLKDVFDEGDLGIIQNVGYPNQNRSHFRSTDIWDTGSVATEVLNNGWIGRYLDTRFPGFPEGYPNEETPHPIAITLGPTVSETCQGIAANFSLAINDPTALANIPGTEGGELPDLPYGYELDFIRQVVAQTNIYAEILSATAEAGTNLSQLYPDPGQNPLADQLKTVAQLISGGLQTKIYVVNINGFDTHANQVDGGDATTGIHAQLLANLSEAIHAFMDDIRLQGNDQRVVGATRSEFGRQIASNGSLGTDHGDAAPLMVFGSCVQSQILGDNPTIPNDPGPRSGVPAQIDFKDVFGSILMDWFGVAENEVSDLFSHDFQHMALIDPCQTTTADHLDIHDAFFIRAYPNPFFEEITAEFNTEGGELRMSLVNESGQEVLYLGTSFFSPGKQQVSHQISELPAGHYYYRLQGRQINKSISLLHF